MFRNSIFALRSCLSVQSTGKIRPFGSTSVNTDSPDVEYYQEQMKQFLTAKNRLAYMMGADPRTFTEQDMKEALAYLVPHHIRPIATKPRIVHPDELRRRDRVELKVLKVDSNDRPLEPGFYTRHPFYNNFQLAVIRFKRYLDTSDETFKPKNIPELPEHRDCTLDCLLDENLFKFIEKDAMELVIGELLTAWHLESIKKQLTELIKYPGADDSVLAFSRPFFRAVVKIVPISEGVEPYTHESGVHVIQQTGSRKSSHAVVKVWPGEGYITINGRSASEYLQSYKDLIQVLYPLNLIGVLGKYSLDCQVRDGGDSGMAGAIRIALSKALAFLEPDSVQILSNAGLLWTDPRKREPNKPGRMRARRGFTWRKR